MRPSSSRPFRSAGAALAVAGALIPTGTALAVQGDLPHPVGSSATDTRPATYDVRRAADAVPATAAQRDAVSQLATSAPRMRAAWDAGFGAPRSTFRRSGYLTAGGAGKPADVAAVAGRQPRGLRDVGRGRDRAARRP